MVMSRFFYLLLTAGLLGLQGCHEEKAAAPSEGQATVVVGVDGPLTNREIDWNLVFATLEGEDVLSRAAGIAGTDSQSLNRVIQIEASPKDRIITITGRHENEETARKYAEAFAGAFEEVRRLLEIESQSADLDRLVRDLDAGQKALVADDEDSPLNQDHTLDQDRMTYEKARKALEEDPVSDDGVIYRKEKK